MAKVAENQVPVIQTDKQLNIATATTRLASKWKNQTLSWSEFVKRIYEPTVTQETMAEYHRMSKREQGTTKDVGGYVGGWLKEGKRKNGYVQQRSLVTLDADSADASFLDLVEMLSPYEVLIYTTHSHTKDKPRYRLVFPLATSVTADEYEPIARKVAEMFGMDYFDDTTYEPTRLMYWGSRARDGDYKVKYLTGDWLKPKEVLGQYNDWKDASFWPVSSRVSEAHKREAEKAGDPLEKNGVIGAFCRTYTIQDAIATFLKDVYLPTQHEDRYTYVDGSTFGGLVIYDDKFAYSHHGTDPIGNQLVNAFDLVRIHLYGDLDSNKKEGTGVTKLPSYEKMVELVQTDPKSFETFKDELLGSATDDFTDIVTLDSENAPEPIKTDWLTVTKTGPDINTHLLAQEVLSEIPTYWDGIEYLRYDRETGVWKSNAEDYVKSYVTMQKLKNMSKMRLLSETLDSMKNQSFNEKRFETGNTNWILLKNGIYDLKTKAFKEGYRMDMHARASHPIQYDPGAKAPLFESFMKLVIGEENLPFIYEWFGYCLFREYAPVQKMLFLHGKGGTGKSTLINILSAFLGMDSIASVDIKQLMEEKFAPINLYQKNANFDADAKPEYLGDAAVLKKLTGDDPFYADRKNREPLTFFNYAKLVFAMNYLPPMRDFSGGLKRRMLILSMSHVITEDEKAEYPLKAILKELPGILNGALEGLERLLKNRDFTVSESISSAVDSWEKGNDVVSLFIDDECTIAEDEFVTSKDLFMNFDDYCKSSNYGRMGRNKFIERIKELGYDYGYKKVEDKTVRGFKGIGLNEVDLLSGF